MPVSRSFQAKYERILKILAKHDIEGLIALGAPKDEYQPEAEAIVGSAYRMTTCRHTEKVLKEIFEHYFDSHYGYYTFQQVAVQVWNVLVQE